MIEDQDSELHSMVYNPRLPIDVVFNAVEDLVDFAALSKQPFTASQMLAKAYIILNQTWRFKLHTTKSWYDFKKHFRRANHDTWP